MKNGVKYIDRDVENDPGALDELQVLGFRSMPVTVIGDKAVAGFNPNQILEALQSTTKVLPRDPSETIPIIERALEAVVHAINQMPDEKLNWHLPQRKRPMREFAFNIFGHALSAMGERVTDASTDAKVKIDSYTGFQDIADYSKTIARRFHASASKQDLGTLRTSQRAEIEVKSGAERLDLAAGQIIQHLRQLYSILESFGITPENRVPDSEWPPEYVLTILW